MTRVLIVGVGRMGFAHAVAASKIQGVEICGLVARNFKKYEKEVATFPGAQLYHDFKTALKKSKPDAVIISTYTDTHALYATLAMEAGAHVFVEKPLGLTRREAGYSIAMARKTGKKLVVGYILRHHAIWKKFVECAKKLTGPYQVKITSNQYSTGAEWELHKNILKAGLSPLTDCGIHYVDIMNQIARGDVIDIKAKGHKDDPEFPVVNDARMTVSYEDGSELYFESGFGPKIYPGEIPIRQVITKDGEVTITPHNQIIFNGEEIHFDKDAYDKSLDAQQRFFFNAIEKDINLEQHWISVAMSHAICFVAEEEMEIY
ncbi:Gfo/Idh/MocA family protein [Pseudemcibacter aquimaris]|uniref:Gfo/Idh/MocA family protein n=1 Tax=Pseudemcibacter aquimaris TaxID=2857064 RepID=UPI002013992E|nr:Gfo/Idh/MocA family oxidoreductase [Pseudemcibacter aquimaris]MCC3859859.1 Gfo/Idh/MocA family oxidoreductase [Pseudemcibacter aquimaris]WDU57191.1 Gfo/Idh/MocA family oxidoreductase [Pseudemcibacter aquimaris]